GAFQLRIDGRLEAERPDLDWHGTWDEYAINALFLENYWNSGSPKRQTRTFDDLVISTHPIGPLVASSPPTLTRTSVPGVAAWEARAVADPAGRDVVRTSTTLSGEAKSISTDAAHGPFSASRRGAHTLAPGSTCWLRLRSRSPAGGWTEWSDSHSPFGVGGWGTQF